MPTKPSREALLATYATTTPSQRAELKELRDHATAWERTKDFAAAGVVERDLAGLERRFHVARAREWDAAQK